MAKKKYGYKRCYKPARKREILSAIEKHLKKYSLKDSCHREGITPASYYDWNFQFYGTRTPTKDARLRDIKATTQLITPTAPPVMEPTSIEVKFGNLTISGPPKEILSVIGNL